MITTFHLPTKIIFGPGSLAQLGLEAKEMGRKAILITGTTSMRQTGVLDGVLRDLKDNGVVTFVFDKVEPNPRTSTVDEGARIAKSKGIDLVIGLGGGAGVRTLHEIAHPLSGHYNIVHADSLAALLLAWMRYTFPVKEERFHSLGRNVFGESDGILATEKWLEKIGMKLRLRDLGAEPERFEEMAAHAVETASRLKYHPRILDAPTIKQIYQDSY